MRNPITPPPSRCLEGEGFAGSGHRNCVNRESAENPGSRAACNLENRQRAACGAPLSRSMDANGLTEVFAAGGLDLNENQFVLKSMAIRSSSRRDLFVFQSGGRSPIPSPESGSRSSPGSGGQAPRPTCRRCGRGRGFAGAGSAEAGCSGAEVCWVRFGLRRGLLFGLRVMGSPR